MHPDKPAHAMVRASLELLGLRLAVEDEVNGPFLWPRLPRSPGPQELVLLQDYRSLASWALFSRLAFIAAMYRNEICWARLFRLGPCSLTPPPAFSASVEPAR